MKVFLISALSLVLGLAYGVSLADQIGTQTFPLTAGEPVSTGEFDAVGHIGNCTATLISAQTVLTAAHCVCQDSSLSKCVTRKTFTLKDVPATNSKGTNTDISVTGTVHVHPDFGKDGWQRKDFALIVLDQPVYLFADVKPMQIASPSDTPSVGQPLTLVGFGPTGLDCSQDRGKQKMTLTVSAVGIDGIKFSHKGLHACPGDSGGPAVNSSGRIVGVASWSNFADESTYRPIYENTAWVDSYLDRTGWQSVSIKARDFLIAYDQIEQIHNVFAINEDDNNIYWKSRPTAEWIKIGGPGKQFALARQSELFALSPDSGGVFRYEGSPGKWVQIGGPASQLYGTPSGLFATNPESGDIYRYMGSPHRWERIGGPGSFFAGDTQSLYGLSPDRQGVFRYDGVPGKWTKIGGAATMIYGGVAGLFATSPKDGSLYRYGGVPDHWQRVGGPGTTFAVASRVIGLSTDKSAVYTLTDSGDWRRIGDAAEAIYSGGSLVCARNPKTHEVFCLDPMRVRW